MSKNYQIFRKKCKLSSVKHKAVKGAMFQSIGGIAQVVIRLIGSMVLARLLVPDDFGVFALVVLVYGLLAQLKTFGAIQAIIARQNVTQRQLSTSFFINFTINLTLFILLWLIATLIADIYDEQRLVDALKVISFIFLFHAFSTVPAALLERSMHFHYVNIIAVSGAIVETVLSIVLVYYYNFDYWALVWGLVIAELYMTLLKILLAGWIPTFEFSKISSLFFIRYGAYLSGENVLMYFRQNIDYFIIGKMLGTTSLGIYSFAYRILNLVSTRLLGPISGVINPSMSIMKTREEVINAFLKFTKYNGYIAAPILISMFVLAEPIILLLWGNQWHEAIPLMKVLVVVAGVQALALPIGSVFLRYNDTKTLFKISIIKVFSSVLIVITFGYFFKIIGIAYGMVVSTILSYFISFYYLKEVVQISFQNIFIALRPLLIISIFTLITTSYAYSLFSFENYLLNIIITTIVCIFSYIGIMTVFKNEWNEIENIIKILNAKKK